MIYVISSGKPRDKQRSEPDFLLYKWDAFAWELLDDTFDASESHLELLFVAHLVRRSIAQHHDCALVGLTDKLLQLDELVLGYVDLVGESHDQDVDRGVTSDSIKVTHVP